MKVQRALISVSDKTGIVAFARGLADLGVEIVSTGGTARSLAEAGIPVTPVDRITGFPEMLDGRVKTLHPAVHGGLLAVRDEPQHVRQLAEAGITPIDLVVVNLYPFEKTVAKPGVSLSEAIENIDIGGPTMLRSAAKNHRFVGAISDPGDYPRVLEELRTNGELTDDTRRSMAVKVFRHTAAYDAAIDRYLSEQYTGERVIHFTGVNGTPLRYGENWHQKAFFYRLTDALEPSLADAEQIWGKQLSYNNYLDMTAAIVAVKDLAPKAAVSVIKHNNPCGLATGPTPAAALRAAWDGDRVSAYGSVIACTVPFDAEAASFLTGRLVESVIAPAFTAEALAVLEKKKAIMLVRFPVNTVGALTTPVIRQVLGGILVQDPDNQLVEKWEIVTGTPFPEGKQALARFALSACKYTKSNAIVLCEEYAPGWHRVLGMGAGQPNRIDSLRKLAATKAIENLGILFDESQPGGDRTAWINARMEETVLASDAFFPFDDSVREAASLGIRYIVQPGGSVRDAEVVAAADELGVAMVFTGMRHFLH